MTGKIYIARKILSKCILPEMLHHSQLAFYEQAFRPVPQENRVFVEQAGKPVADNGAISQFYPTLAHFALGAFSFLLELPRLAAKLR